MPLLHALCAEGRSVVFISPPHTPYAPALVRAGLPLERVLWISASGDEDARWAAEQVLREGLAGAVLLWSSTEDDRSLRRLQLAAETGQTFAFLYRSTASLQRSSPAALRMSVSPLPEGLRATVTKVRGGSPRVISLPLRPAAM
jgi:cell division inhibitor SulA/protein ImuA